MSTATSARKLHGPGLPAELAARIAASTGLTLGEAAAEDAGPGDLHLVALGEVEGLGTALRGVAAGVVEVIAEHSNPIGDADLAGVLAAGVFHVSLTTRTAWSLDTAAAFCEGLIARSMMPGYLRHDVELALHEAVINAVLHGNLGIGSSLFTDPTAFDAFCRLLTDQLGRPEKALLRIDLTARLHGGCLEVSVLDRGPGYDPASVQPAAVDAKSGRGLEIMRQLSTRMEVGEGGRKVTLGFTL